MIMMFATKYILYHVIPTAKWNTMKYHAIHAYDLSCHARLHHDGRIRDAYIVIILI